jgi:hypothetical protein
MTTDRMPQAKDAPMSQSTRKLLGTLAVLGSIILWSIAATAIYVTVLPNADWWVLIVFFAIAGTSWFFPAAWIIRWMSGPGTD